MNDSKDIGYIIDQVSWHTEVQGNGETPAEVYARFRSLFAFLESNKLLSSGAPLPSESGALPCDFHLHTQHLTSEGHQVIRSGYDRWLKALSKKRIPSKKTTILENALRTVRASNA